MKQMVWFCPKVKKISYHHLQSSSITDNLQFNGRRDCQESCHHCGVARQPAETPHFSDESRKVLLRLGRGKLFPSVSSLLLTSAVT